MRRVGPVLVILAGVLASAPAAAQGTPDPPGPYVLDVRGVTSGVPEGASFLPPLAADTPVPTRGVGFDVGLHFYGGRLGTARLGFGANLLSVRTEAIPARAVPSTTSSTPPTGPPGMHVDMRTIAPQLSFNFGTADGWSYLSTGVGYTEMTARAVDGADARRESGRLMTINAGGGARWFLTRRLAFGFDARLHRVAAGDTSASAMLFSISAGVSLR